MSQTKRKLIEEGKLKTYFMLYPNKELTDEWRKKIGLASKILWTREEYCEKVLSTRLRSSFKRPTEPERRFIQLVKKHNLPFRYVGNGKLIINRMNPDFVEDNGKKRCIEVFGSYWHRLEDEEKRTRAFINKGWKCLVIWDSELYDEKILLTKIYDFLMS